MPGNHNAGPDAARRAPLGPWTVLAASAVLLLAGWALVREGRARADGARLFAEVARWRTGAEGRAGVLGRVEGALAPAADSARWAPSLAEEETRIRRLEDTPGAPENWDGIGAALSKESETLDRLEKSFAGLKANSIAAPRTEAVPRAKEILDGLAAIADGSEGRAVGKGFRELVRLGDPAVPGIAALLDSGLQRDYAGSGSIGGSFGAHAGQRVHSSLRALLYDALGQIGTPAAREAALESAAKSDRLDDLRDLLYFYRDETDPVVVDRISALVAEALRKVASVDAWRTDVTLSMWLTQWIRKRWMTGTAGLLEEVVSGAKARPDGWSGPDTRYFTLLAILSPEGASRAVLALQRKHQGLPTEVQAIRHFTFALTDNASLASLARYLGGLLTEAGLPAETRKSLYSAVPGHQYLHEAWTPAQRREDAKALVAFLESRLPGESDADVRAIIQEKLEVLRQSMEQSRKGDDRDP
jgi:hypothetical protein